jgi:glutamine amidotransferase
VKRVVVLDYGSGNLRSAERALARVGAEVIVTADRDLALAADGLVVPGVGAYAACMEGLDAVGAREVVEQRVTNSAPVLGICVGMQAFFELGVEHGVQTKGLGVLPGEVRQLDADVLPHMGWNTIDAHPESLLLSGIDPDERFYFVHSYAAPAVIGDASVSTATHGRSTFAAIVERGELRATQFHPEKSGDTGARMLETWVGEL